MRMSIKINDLTRYTNFTNFTAQMRAYFWVTISYISPAERRGNMGVQIPVLWAGISYLKGQCRNVSIFTDGRTREEIQIKNLTNILQTITQNLLRCIQISLEEGPEAINRNLKCIFCIFCLVLAGLFLFRSNCTLAMHIHLQGCLTIWEFIRIMTPEVRFSSCS